jgi:hypothetical protein
MCCLLGEIYQHEPEMPDNEVGTNIVNSKLLLRITPETIGDALEHVNLGKCQRFLNSVRAGSERSTCENPTLLGGSV